MYCYNVPLLLPGVLFDLDFSTRCSGSIYQKDPKFWIATVIYIYIEERDNACILKDSAGGLSYSWVAGRVIKSAVFSLPNSAVCSMSLCTFLNAILQLWCKDLSRSCRLCYAMHKIIVLNFQVVHYPNSPLDHKHFAVSTLGRSRRRIIQFARTHRTHIYLQIFHGSLWLIIKQIHTTRNVS